MHPSQSAFPPQGQRPHHQPPMGQPPAPPPPHGQPPHGQRPSAHPAAPGQPSLGQPSLGQPSLGQPAPGQPAPGVSFNDPTQDLPHVAGAAVPAPYQPDADPASQTDTLSLRHDQPGYTREYPHVPHHHTAAGPRPRRSRAPLYISLSVLVVLLLTGGAVAGAWVWYGWGETLPENVLPGSSVAFVRADLSPGLGQKIMLDNLAKKFPGAGARDSADSLAKWLIDRLGLAPLDYDRDVRPWFGNRVGAALWSPDGSVEHMCGLVALATSSADQTTAALGTVRDHRPAGTFGFIITDGYGLVAMCEHGTDSQSAARAAAAEGTHASLAGQPAFEGGVAKLPSGQTILGYADLGRARDIAPSLFHTGAMDQLIAPTLTGLAGDIVLGIRATAGGVDIAYRWRDSGTTHTGSDVLAGLGAMPGNTIIGVSADLGGTSLVKDLPLGLGGAATATGGGLDALLRSVVTVSVDSLGSGAALRVMAKAPDADQAHALGAMLGSLPTVDGLAAGPAVDVFGDRVTVTTPGYHEGNGILTDSTLYREAMGAAAGTSILAAYVDVAAVTPYLGLSAASAANLAPVRAIGLTAGYQGDTAVADLRIVIN
jgi:hypothetical protein